MSAIIKALPQEIVDRIAAGEVVQRPCSIVKELIENSLDASCTSVDITCDKGGLGLIQISDDGCGFSKEDMKLAAVRFATSKLVSFDDLKSIRTFGFRGEALASASMVSHLSILSKRNQDTIASKCDYHDGLPLPNTLKPAAGVNGTTVTIADLFYNMPSRKRAFKRDSDEYNAILDVVQKYAVHRAGDGVGMVCKKKAGASVDLNTKSLTTVSALIRRRKTDAAAVFDISDCIRARREAIGHVYGGDVARELLPLDSSEGDLDAAATAALVALQANDFDLASSAPTDAKFAFAYKVAGLVTNASYPVKASSAAFVIFINDRLVECSGIRRAIEAVYHDLLPTRGKPFVYLSLEVPGPHVDVNVHPTKKEVKFLHEDKLCEALALVVRNVLSSSTSSRTFEVASVVPTRKEEERDKERTRKREERDNSSTTTTLASFLPTSDNANGPAKKAKPAYNPTKLVRTSAAARPGALEPFLSQPLAEGKQRKGAPSAAPPPPEETALKHDSDCERRNVDMTKPGAFAIVCRCNAADVSLPKPTLRRPAKVVAVPCNYSTINQLRADVLARADRNLSEKLKSSTFVGTISRTRSLVQVNTELLMISHHELAKELFYQLALARFGGCGKGMMQHPGVEVVPCIQQALSVKDDDEEEMGSSKLKDATDMSSVLVEKSGLLEQYFGIEISRGSDGKIRLKSLPQLLEQHEPAPHALPQFLMRLASEIEYGDERSCFEGICGELGIFYAELPLTKAAMGNASGSSQSSSSSSESAVGEVLSVDEATNSFVQHKLYPALAYLLVPPKEFSEDGSVGRMALLSSLYKVFERC